MRIVGTEEDLHVAKVREALEGLTVPPEIDEFRVRLDTDWSGEPGIFIEIGLSIPSTFSDADVKRLSLFASVLADRVIRAGAAAFPYVSLMQAA